MKLNGRESLRDYALDELLEALRDITQTVFKEAKCTLDYRCETCPYASLCDAAFEFQRDCSCGPRGSRPAYKAIAEALVTMCADESADWESYCYDKALSALMDVEIDNIG